MSELIERIRERIVEEGDCWNWNGAMQSCGSTPVMRWQGKIGAVRRFVMLEKPYVAVKQKWFATYLCGNPLCVNPQHTGWRDRRTVQLRTTNDQRYQASVVSCKKIADKARARAKLTVELATAIREAEGGQRQIAERFGVHQATVSSIKRGRTWREYAASPFAGLGAR